ncbi:L-threonine 3-dehydrogenase [Aurantiacibacter gangjinensis]|uniref:L-threonine 3-dehydrogenase n=1 Tax=Aurantiacibacter gangjinensis TaxID=502682 RepID=A0A0G9MQ56_9SPHN|nr:L-threonine 3-dehydrogenase [Aurantiacibacter gangjinensis]APE28678.1 L-threonine 3-dehydrogenase [Aurantiacibacter gangjinensis]KLE32845.1 L-threonine 3-dehydrogenase [Aurantiacibacter gangjinensis]
MKALVKAKAEPGLWLQDVPKPEMGINDVMIRVKRTAICGTDMHIYKWDEWAQKTIPVPMVVGHEFVGEIVDIGDNVKGYEKGQIVSGEGHVVCGRCRNCMAGRRHMCADADGIGVNRPGAFAEYLCIPAANVWLHNDGIDLDVASLFDPFGNAVHTALQFNVLGEDVLIIGAGPIGLMAAAVCRHAGARHVVITDLNDNRLEMAKQLGVTRAVNVTRETIEDVQKELGMAEGFDVGLEMSGNEKGFASLVDNMAHGGKIAILGLPPGGMDIDWHKVIFNMLTLKGVYGREIFETWYKMSVFIESGLDLSPIITHRLPYTEYEKGFQAMLSGEACKVVLNWED